MYVCFGVHTYSHTLHIFKCSFIHRKNKYLVNIKIELLEDLYIHRITGLPIVGNMYDEFFPKNKLILDKMVPGSL